MASAIVQLPLAVIVAARRSAGAMKPSRAEPKATARMFRCGWNDSENIIVELRQRAPWTVARLDGVAEQQAILAQMMAWPSVIHAARKSPPRLLDAGFFSLPTCAGACTANRAPG